MKILFDSQGFDMQTHGGVTRCFVELYKHFPVEVDARFSVVETNNVYLNNIGFPNTGNLFKQFPFRNNSKFKKICFKLYYNAKYGNLRHWDIMPNFNLIDSIHQIKTGNYDIFHPTFFSPYFLPYLKDRPMVLTVHDMITELFTNYFPPTDNQVIWKKILIPRANHIVTVSEQTKKDLQHFFNVPDSKITVIYHGADQTPYTPAKEKPYEGDYILYVGDRWGYKNFRPFVKHVSSILKRHKNINVICTGRAFNDEEIQLFNDTGVANRFVQIYVKSDQDFMDLYHNAIAFVYPSEYEGFGIPILEAYKADCPVMLNHASCFPEIAGDAAVYFNMKDGKSDFEEQFETLYHLNSNEREALLQKQRERLTLYTWEKSAQQLAAVYQKIC